MKTRVSYVTADDLREIRQMLYEGNTYHTLGTHSVYIPSLCRKYVDQSVVKLWPDADNEPVLMTPGQAARAELSREFPDLTRVGWSGPMIKLLDKRVPLHYTGTIEGDLMYIDLVGAYHQIYQRLWLDTSYPGGYYGQYPLLYVAGRLHSWKAARNAVIGISRMRTITAARGGHRMTPQVKNKYLSPGLWATVIDTLHWIARIAIDCGCIYVHTDGYMFHQGPSADIFMEILIELGIVFEIRGRGKGEVKSWCNYKIGQKETKSYSLGLIQKSKEFSNVYNPPRDWAKYWRNLEKLVRFGDLRGASRET